MTVAGCRTAGTLVPRSGLPLVFVRTLVCISMQMPGGLCNFLRAGTMLQYILVCVPRPPTASPALPSVRLTMKPPHLTGPGTATAQQLMCGAGHQMNLRSMRDSFTT
jgi:hypothetical protein